MLTTCMLLQHHSNKQPLHTLLLSDISTAWVLPAWTANGMTQQHCRHLAQAQQHHSAQY